ncbi:MAG: proton-conducting transporter membrane subunit [Chloroflexota bacterium]
MGLDVIFDFLGQAFTDRNLMLWLIPLGPLSAFVLISFITLILWLVRQVTGTQENMIPASDHHYNDHHHPDYGGMEVPYQPDWFRVTAVVIGMAGIIWALIISWTLVFGALNDFGAGTFGSLDSAAYYGDDSHSEGDESHSEDEAHGDDHGSSADCAPCVYSDEITWMSIGAEGDTTGVVPDESTDYEIGVLLDPLNITLLFMVPIAMLGIFTYSIGYMAHDARQAKFFALISLFATAMFVLTIADNLMMLFVGWEIMGFCSYSLIGFWYEKRSAYKAAIKAFTVTRVADVVMLLGIVYLWNIAGTLNFRDILYNPEVLQMIGSTPAIIFGGFGMSAAGLIGVFLLIGTVGKSAQFPLHVWLPDAMEGPTPVSAMIHAAAMVSAGVYAIIRMYPLFVALTNPHASDPTFSAPLIIMAVVGSFTALFAATMGVAQRDVKAVLAYSTISQLGFMVAALGVGAYIAATFHLITHAFFKALLFMASGAVIHAMEHGEHHVHEHHAAHGHDDHAHDEHHDEHGHDEHHADDEHGVHFDPQDMFNMGGLNKRIPVTFWTFLAGGFSLAGFPLITAGFWSKDEILAESWFGFVAHGSGLHAMVFFVLALAAFLTAFYTMRQIALTFLGEPRTEEAEHAGLGGQYNIVSITMQAPLILLAVFALGAGFIGVPDDFPIFGAIFSPEHNYFHHLVIYALPFMENGGSEVFHVDAPAFNIIPVAVSFIVALGGLWLGWKMYGEKPLEAGEEDPLIKYLGEPIYTALQNRYYMDDLYDLIFVRPAQWISRGVITLLDKGIIDTVLHTLGFVFTVIGDFIKVMNKWLIDGVGDGVPKGIWDFGGWARQAQNGRIQFYLLIVLAAVLVIGVIFAITTGAVLAS